MLISPSDPSSAWTAKANKRVQFGYGPNYLIDIANAIIVDVEPTPFFPSIQPNLHVPPGAQINRNS